MKSQRLTKRGAIAVVTTFFVCASVWGETPATTSQPATENPANRTASYAPGIRIDWACSIVELEGKIVLRRGPLELFACSSHTREHESIVAVIARPLRLFEAMGLIGLTPGTPARYDASRRRWTAARGAPLRIDVVVRDGRAERVFGANEWMRHCDGGAPMERRDWLFAGSRRLPGKRFAADVEGTIICVVDFDSALIALPESHTADNTALWLEANPKRVPPVGTTCVIRISSAERGRTTVHVKSSGKLRMNGLAVTAANVEKHLRTQMTNDPGANVLLVPRDKPAHDHATALKKRLAAKGLNVLLRSPEGKVSVNPCSGWHGQARLSAFRNASHTWTVRVCSDEPFKR